MKNKQAEMNKATIKVVKGQVAKFLPREEFRKRFDANFYDPAFDASRDAIGKLEGIAWEA